MLAPRGLIYFPKPRTRDGVLPFPQAIHAGISESVNRMLFSPLPFGGIRGIRYLSRRVRKWPRLLKDEAQVQLYLANVVRMQEEIGTGGAGFRFLYAAFLQEAGGVLQNEALNRAAKQMTEVGNRWRDFATLAAKFCKGRLENPYSDIPDLLLEISEKEKQVYRALRRDYL